MIDIREDISAIVAHESEEGHIPTIAVRLFNGQSYTIQVKALHKDFIWAKVSNSYSRRIAIAAIAEYWDVTGKESHPFKDIEPREE